MLPVLLSLMLTASPPPEASRATELAGKRDWAELYLAFVNAPVDTYSAPERERVATALLQGCRALLKGDAVLASSLGEAGARFHPSADATLCQAQGATRSKQHGFALSTLQDAHDRYPEHAGIALALGEALLGDREPRIAIGALSRVAKGTPEHARAQRLLAQAKAAIAEKEAAEAEALQRERATMRAAEAAREREEAPMTEREMRTRPASARGSDGLVAGMNSRTHKNFSIRYFANGRDFGERATYQTRIIDALDASAAFTRKVLGFACEKPIDVILYSREEFAAHMGAAAASRVAGLYSMSAIRLNDAAELTRQTRATLTHEYVHAVVDELAGGRSRAVPIWFNEGLAEYVEWRFLGSKQPPHATKIRLRGAAVGAALPSLEDLSRGALIGTQDPALSYAVSALAVRHLLDTGSSLALRKLIVDVAQGTPFPESLRRHFHITVAQLDRAVASAAKSR